MARTAGSASATAAGSGKRWVSPPSGAGRGVPTAADEPGGVGAGGHDGHLLTEDGSDGQLRAVDVPGRAPAGRLGDERGQELVGLQAGRSRPPDRHRGPSGGGTAGRRWRGPADRTAAPRTARGRARASARRLRDRGAGAASGGTCRRPPPRCRARHEGRGRRAARRRRTAGAPGAGAARCPSRRPLAAERPLRAGMPSARSSVGVVAKTSRTVSLNCRMLANPAPKATCANGRSVVSMSTRAVWARWARARAMGPAPTSATSWRCRWRSLYPRRSARPRTPSRSTTPSAMRRMARPTTSARRFHSGEPGVASGRQRLQARKPASCAAAAVG